MAIKVEFIPKGWTVTSGGKLAAEYGASFYEDKVNQPQANQCPDCKGSGTIMLLNSVKQCHCRGRSTRPRPSVILHMPLALDRDVIQLEWTASKISSLNTVAARGSILVHNSRDPNHDNVADLQDALMSLIDELEKIRVSNRH
jgi:DnaJ-class molecular chaperone